MPYKSEAQRRFFNSPAGKEKLGEEEVEHWNEVSKGMKLPEKAIDRAIRILDSKVRDASEVHYLFYRDIDGSVRVEKFGSISSMRNRFDKLKEHDITKLKEWTHAEWAKEDFDKIYNKMKSSV